MIDLDTFGLLGGSNAFEAISGPAGQWLHPDGAELLVAYGLDLENGKNITFFSALWIIVLYPLIIIDPLGFGTLLRFVLLCFLTFEQNHAGFCCKSKPG